MTVSNTAEAVKVTVTLHPLPKRIGFAGLGCEPRSAAVRDANDVPLAPAVQKLDPNIDRSRLEFDGR